MKAILKSVLSLIVIPLGIAFAIEVLSPFAPETLPALQRWVAAVTEWSGFPWLLAGSLGLLVGLSFDRWVGARDGRSPSTRIGKLQLLVPKIESLALDCDLLASGDPLTNINTVAVELQILGEKLHALGIDLPWLPDGIEPRTGFANVSMMLRSILPAIKEGDLALTEHVSRLVRGRQLPIGKGQGL